MDGSGRWNLAAAEWAKVLLDGLTPASVAESLLQGDTLPWTAHLVALTRDSSAVLDLGSGRGDQAAVLGLNGRQPTLLDWSGRNLAFSAELFRVLGLVGRFCRADLTEPLPFHNDSFDTVYSCGVLEYFDQATIERLVAESFRVSRRRVIMMVPNALSLAYRVGKWYMQRTGGWQWGGEVPFYSLRGLIRRVSPSQVKEYSVGTAHALKFLTMPGGGVIRRVATRVLRGGDDSGPSRLRQGYLLLTVAEKT